MNLESYFNKIGPGIYSLIKDKSNNKYQLQWKYMKWDTPETLVGTIVKRRDKILKTFKESPTGTGVILHGLKGMGKSVLSKLVSNEMVENEYPVIIIENEYFDSEFKSFLESLGDICVIFDEFTRVYSRTGQDSLLTLLDGMSKGKRLVLMTTNSISETIDPLNGRPGRVYYKMKFSGIELPDAIEYFNKFPLNKDTREFLEFIILVRDDVSWDVLKVIVNEALMTNNLNEFSETLVDINVTVNDLIEITCIPGEDVTMKSRLTSYIPPTEFGRYDIEFTIGDQSQVHKRSVGLDESYVKLMAGMDSFVDVNLSPITTLELFYKYKDGVIKLDDIERVSEGSTTGRNRRRGFFN